MNLSLATRLEPSLTAASEIPETAGVYCLHPIAGDVYIGASANLRRRITRLVKTFGDRIESVECWPAASKLDGSLLLYALTRQLYPRDYMRRLHLRPPAFLSLTDSDAFPQLVVSNRILNEASIGPFPSRDAAEAYQESVNGLFQLRRCPGALEPDPAHPGCVYGEMHQCLRPCQLAVSENEYRSEVQRVREFLATNGRTAIQTSLSARDRASERLDFEGAAALHKRVERMKAAAGLRDSLAVPISRFCGIALTPGFGAGECLLRPVSNGIFQESVSIQMPDAENTGRSLDAEIRERLAEKTTITGTLAEAVEHLAIFQRWFRSSYCDGQWFPSTAAGDVDYRRVVRGVSKLFAARGDKVSC